MTTPADDAGEMLAEIEKEQEYLNTANFCIADDQPRAGHWKASARSARKALEKLQRWHAAFQSLKQRAERAEAEVALLRTALSLESGDTIIDASPGVFLRQRARGGARERIWMLADEMKELEMLRHYAGKQTIFSDYQTADHMRDALNESQAENTKLQARVRELEGGGAT